MQIFKASGKQYPKFQLSKKESKEVFIHRGKTQKKIQHILDISHLDEIYEDMLLKVLAKNGSPKEQGEIIVLAIQDFYFYLSSLVQKNDQISISLPEQLIELSEKYLSYDYVICGDNPGNTEYQKHIGFNSETQNGEYMRSLFPGNIFFFNKTFISTAITSELFTDIQRELLEKSLAFNAKILSLLGEIIPKPLVIVGGNSIKNTDFKSFFSHLKTPYTISPHSSRSMIFRAQADIPGWNKRFKEFLADSRISPWKEKLLTENGNLSYKHIQTHFTKSQQRQILDLYREIVILGKK